jgi:hypothetical protein
MTRCSYTTAIAKIKQGGFWVMGGNHLNIKRAEDRKKKGEI